MPKNKPELRDALMAALTALQDAGMEAALLTHVTEGQEGLDADAPGVGMEG